MKKLIKVAFALLLASSALLISGCTKDFKSEVKKFDPRVTKLEDAVSALQAFQASAQSAIDKNTSALAQLQKDVDNLEALTDALAIATSAELLELSNDAEDAINDIYDKIAAVESDLADLKAAKDTAIGALADLKEEIGALAVRIKTIVAYPTTVDDIRYIAIPDIDTTKIFAGIYEISPSKMASKINKDNITLHFREGITKAPVDMFPEIYKVEVDPVAGQVAVYASAMDMPDPTGTNKIYQSLTFCGPDDAGVEYEVASDYVPTSSNNSAVAFSMRLDEDVINPMAVYDTIDYTALAPYDMLAGFEPVVVIDGEAFNAEELKEYLNFAEAPVVTITDSVIVTALPFVLDTAKYVMNFNTTGFTSAALIGQTASVKVTYRFNGVDNGLTATKYLTIGRHEVTLDPSETQIIQWDYTHASGVNYTASDVVVPAEVYASSTVTLGDKKIYKSADPSQTAVAGNVAVSGVTTTSGVTKGTVAITGVVPGKNEVDYTFIQKAYDDTLNLIAPLPFTVMPRPLDKEYLTLADSTITYSSDGTVIRINPIDIALTAADTTEYFAGLAAGDPARDLYKMRKAMADGAVVSIKALSVDGRNISTGNISQYVALNVGYDLATKKDTTALTIKNKLEQGQEATIKFEIKAFGVTYTYTQYIEVNGLPYNLIEDPLFVDADHYVYTKGILDDTTTPPSYKLNAHDMANYVKLTGKVPSNENNVKVNYKFYNELDSIPASPSKGITALPTAPSQAAAPANAEVLASAPFSWGSFSANELHASAWLSISGKRVSDSIAIKIVSVQPVDNFVGGEISATRVTGNDLEINLWKKMEAVGCLADTNIILQNAATLAAAIAGNVNYGQGLEAIDFTAATAKLADGTPYTMNPAFFSVSAGVLTIAKECGVFTQPVIITIPVKLDYMLDYQHKQALESNVIVTVNQQ